VALQRVHARDASARVAAARADLARRSSQLGAYRAVGRVALGGSGLGGLGGLGGGFPTSALGGLAVQSTMAAPGGGATWLSTSGLADFAVAEADFSDNPIVGTWGGGGFGRADYRWAVAAWDEVIRPGLDRGMTREDFAARDAARGARLERQTANVYDWFLKDAITVERRANGSLNPINGRHRVEMARELGITHLPAKWLGQ
jgi:hypothetical protein